MRSCSTAPAASGCGASSAITPGSSATDSSSRARSKRTARSSSEDDRRKFEDSYLAGAKRRDSRDASRVRKTRRARAPASARSRAPDNNDNARQQRHPPPPTSVDGLIRQTRQPQFVSSAYFLRFKFDEGQYALAGREKFEGRDVLRDRVLPDKAVWRRRRRRGRRGAPAARATEKEQRQQADFRRLLNKVAVVTHLGRALVASDRQVHLRQHRLRFPAGAVADTGRLAQSLDDDGPAVSGVWLPKDIDISAAFTMAIGQFTFSQTVAYRDYREANVKSKFRVQ